MSKLKVLVAFFAVLALLLVPATALAQERPPGPSVCAFSGKALIDGEEVSSGTGISAWIEGEKVPGAETDTSDSGYYLQVTGNYQDKEVSFKIKGLLADQTAIWDAGETIELDLTASTPPPAESAALKLSPEKGVGAVIVSGRNFTPNQDATISWEGRAVTTVPEKVKADAKGRFTAAVTAPTTKPGSYKVSAADATGRSAEATFEVVGIVGITKVETKTLPPGEMPTAEFDRATGVLTLSIPKGEPGERGPKGEPGPAGERGEPGAAITKVEINTLSPGEEATAEYDPKTGALSLEIPKGEKGETGEVGSAGSPGAKGESGPAGPPGPGAPGGAALPIAAIVLSVVAIILVFVFRPGAPKAE